MMVELRPAAEADVRAIVAGYRAIRPTLGEEFLEGLDELLERLRVFPRSAPVVDGLPPIRRGLVRRFPHAVFFVVVNDRVTILRVLHATRDERPTTSDI